MLDDPEEILNTGLAQLGVAAKAEQRGQLLRFVHLLSKWNRVYNLTAIRSLQDSVRLNLLDSLSLLSYLEGERILDVGTGAGLPGIPLAILKPLSYFTLLDSNAKKTRFVQQAAIDLGLANVSVAHTRIEDFHPDRRYDVVLARAFASVADIVRLTRRLLAPAGTILAQKGKLPMDEIAAVKDVAVEALPLSVPGVDAQRHLLAIRIHE